LRFFFYGTLVAGSANPVAAALHCKLGPGAAATACGTLHAIPDPGGWYPAFVAGEAGGVVHGMLHEALPQFGADDLALLDRYEDCAPTGGEYRRTVIRVLSGAGDAVPAYCYIYAQPLPAGARALANGDFLAFIRANRLPEYCDPE
jgi:gamma-glutamylcyclotransferase (GGCT)/AIG2-like uncharacterized protein YtfP